MKKRVLSILLLAVFLPCLAVFASASGEEGLAFDEKYHYMAAKTYDRTPNTFEAWINLPESAASTRAGVILGNYGEALPCINFEIYEEGNPRLYWNDSNDLNGLNEWIFSDVNVCTGEWLHLAVVRDKDAQEVRCYVNGELASTKVMYKANRDLVCVDPFAVGGDCRAENGMFFRGRIRSVATYDDVRTADEIKADMVKPEPDGSLIAYYDLTAADGRIEDLSGNGYHVSKYEKYIWADKENKKPVSDFDYTFAVVGDTQVISDRHSDRFHLIYDWIMDNKEEKNIEFVMGLGDITEKSQDKEWMTAMNNIRRMEGVIPFSLVRGNHDAIYEYNKYYPYAIYGSTVGGTYDSTMLNTWQELVVGNRKYIIFTLDFGASDEVLTWAGGVIEDYPEHNVIITTHAYLFRDGTTLDEGDVCPPATNGGYNNGDHMWDKLISQHENIMLVLSGHDPCGRIVTAQTKGKNGNIVTQMLIDPQGVDVSMGGLGMVALLHFSDDSDEIEVEYYSTFKEQYFKSENQFVVTLDFVGEDPIEEIRNDPPADTTIGSETPDPDTGSNGNTLTVVWIVGGVLLVALAVVLTVVIRRRKK